MKRIPVILLVAAGLALAAGCQKSKPAPGVSRKDADYVQKILSDTAGSEYKPAPAAIDLPASVVFTRDDIPNEGGYLQVSIGDITDEQANRLMRRLKTERCTCGCPHTIDQCLVEDPQCDVAPRLATQVLKEVIASR